MELVSSSNSLISGNSVVRHSQVGIVLFDMSKQNRIELNSVRRYGGNGVLLNNRSNANTIAQNTVSRSAGSEPFGGIEILDSRANRVRRTRCSGTASEES